MTAISSTERTVLVIAGGLVLLGTAGIGIIEIIAGTPHPVTSEGQIVHDTLVPLAIRSYAILLGFLLWAGYGVYRVLNTTPAGDPDSSAF